MITTRKSPIAVLGLPLNPLTLDEAVSAVDGLIQSGGSHQVATANLDFWLNSTEDSHLHRVLASCSLVLPDGMPLVWASRLLGTPLPERVTGVDMVPRLAALSEEKGYRIFLLGARAGVADRMAEQLRREYPRASIVGTFAPAENTLARMDHDEILERVHAAKADILLVAFGHPKQEKWIWMHRHRLNVPVTIGVGGSFDILVGDTQRAPRWMQRSGLEWLMRYLQEPARLGPRYLRDFIGLVRHLPLAMLAKALQRPYVGSSSLTAVRTATGMHVYVSGKLGSELTADLNAVVEQARGAGLQVIVHLQAVQQICTSGLGMLLSARRELLEDGLSLLVAGLNARTRFLLSSWSVLSLVGEWHPQGARSSMLSVKSEQIEAAEQEALRTRSGIRA